MKTAIRKLGLVLLVATLAAGSAWAQHDDRRERRGDERFRTPHWVYDSHHHLNHYYPSRGQVVVGVPAGAISVTFGGARLFFSGGVWFRPSGPRFVVVAPPLGVVVPVLPPAYVTLWVGGAPYYHANDVYYTPAPGGYVVTALPPGATVAAAPPPPPVAAPAPDLIVYPRDHQSPEQTAADRSACAQWATQQATGKDASVFQRAMSACMDARGYTVR